MSKLGRKILTALQEFDEALESGEPLERCFTIRSYETPAEPSDYDGPKIRAVRDAYSMSQGIFARFLCVSPGTVQSWEQGRRKPSPIARRLLDEMVAGPEHFRSRFAALASPRSSPSAEGKGPSRRGTRGPRKGRVEA